MTCCTMAHDQASPLTNLHSNMKHDKMFNTVELDMIYHALTYHTAYGTLSQHELDMRLDLVSKVSDLILEKS